MAVVPPMSKAIALASPMPLAQRLGADHARRRPRFQHPDAGFLRFADGEQPPGRLHDQEVAGESGRLEMLADLAEIAPTRGPT